MRAEARLFSHLRPRRATAAGPFLAWGAWMLMAALVIGGGLIWLFDGRKHLPISFAHGTIGIVAVAGCAVVFTSLGAILASRLSRNPIGWMLLAIGMLFAFLTPVNLLIQGAFEVARPFPRGTLVIAWVMSSIMTPIIAGFIMTVCLVFPDGRIPSGRWWAGVVLSLVGALLLAVASALEPTGLIWYPTLPNPAALPGEYRPLVGALRLASMVALIGGAVVSSAAVAVRYRRAGARGRAQLRWIVVGVATSIAGLLPFLIARYVLQVGEAAGEILIGVAALATCAFPVSVALAIVRQRLFDIDTVISRGLVYVPLMGILAGVYTACVTLFQRIFVSLTSDGSDAAIVLSALILASVFAPIRSALEVRVNRRFRPAERAGRQHPHGEPMPAQVTPAASASGSEDVHERVTAQPWQADLDMEARIAALEASLAELRRLELERTHRTATDSTSHGVAKP